MIKIYLLIASRINFVNAANFPLASATETRGMFNIPFKLL